jgi:hypothetical protein
MVNRTVIVPGKCEWRRSRLRCLGFALAVVVLVWVPSSVQSGESAPSVSALFSQVRKQAVAAAAAAAAMAHPAGACGILLAGQSLDIWEPAPAPPQDKAASSTDRTPVIDPDLLAGVEDRAEMRNAAENYNEARAYNYLLVLASATPVTAFAKSSRRDLTFAHLFEEPGKYRGQVVHIEGRLKRLRRFDAPRLAAKQGVPVIYEGWIFGDAYFSNPYCVLATANPDSIPLGDTIEHQVSFDGYFFKRYRYKAGDGWRDAPLLIGHAVRERAAPNPASDTGGSFAALLLPGLIAVVGATVLLVLCLNWWFRRSDRHIRPYMDLTRNARFVEPERDDFS